MYQFEVLNEKTVIDELPKVKKKSPFDFINSINDKNNIRDQMDGYSQFMINKGFSQFRDTILFANELNKYSSIDNVMHYDALFHFVSKKKRFAKWGKSDYDEVKLSKIMEYYNINRRKAIEIIDLIDYEMILNGLYRGGTK